MLDLATATTAFCPTCTSIVDITDDELECVSCGQTFELVTEEPTAEPETPTISVAVRCPDCCQPTDVLAEDNATVVVKCSQCGQGTKLVVSEERFAEHAI